MTREKKLNLVSYILDKYSIFEENKPEIIKIKLETDYNILIGIDEIEELLNEIHYYRKRLNEQLMEEQLINDRGANRFSH